MQRCIQMSGLGAGSVAPNPMVGAVLVYNDRIIGEGWHQKYGEAHAEVNCLKSVQEKDKELISRSTLFVSLEPCAHFGKTPPCTDLIIKNKIPKVVIGCRDPFKEVNGKGIEKLSAAGIEVVTGILEEECIELNKRFFTFHTKQRPYVILKWAQTKDGFMAPLNPPQGGTLASQRPRLFISNDITNCLVHKWRSEEAAIMIGTNTALLDNPELTTRLWPGNSPVRLVIDLNQRLPGSLNIFDGKVKTIVFNYKLQEKKANLVYFKIDKAKPLIEQLMESLYNLQLQSVIVEGGAKLLQSFVDDGIWDEARVITNTTLTTGNGMPAPLLKCGNWQFQEKIQADSISYFRNKIF